MWRVIAAGLLAVTVLLVPGKAFAQERMGAPCGKIRGSQEFAPWAGEWSGHGAMMTVIPEGCVSIAARPYSDGTTVKWASGAFVVLLTRAGTSASGRALPLTGSMIDGEGAVLRLEDDGTLTAEWDGVARTFCRPTQWDSRCGA